MERHVGKAVREDTLRRDSRKSTGFGKEEFKREKTCTRKAERGTRR